MCVSTLRHRILATRSCSDDDVTCGNPIDNLENGVFAGVLSYGHPGERGSSSACARAGVAWAGPCRQNLPTAPPPGGRSSGRVVCQRFTAKWNFAALRMIQCCNTVSFRVADHDLHAYKLSLDMKFDGELFLDIKFDDEVPKWRNHVDAVCLPRWASNCIIDGSQDEDNVFSKLFSHVDYDLKRSWCAI